MCYFVDKIQEVRQKTYQKHKNKQTNKPVNKQTNTYKQTFQLKTNKQTSEQNKKEYLKFSDLVNFKGTGGGGSRFRKLVFFVPANFVVAIMEIPKLFYRVKKYFSIA